MVSMAFKSLENRRNICLWPITNGRMEEKDGENILLFLLSATSNALPSSNLKLKSYLNTHLTNFAEKVSLKLPKRFTSRNFTCPHCCVPWSNNTTSLKLLPTRKLKKHERLKKDKTGGRTESQVSELRNKLALKCEVCSKTSSFSLVKKIKSKNIEPEIIELEIPKKKKKKDKNCGLKTKYVEAAKDFRKESYHVYENRISSQDSTKSKFHQSINGTSSASSFHKNNLNSQKETTKKLINPFAPQVQKLISKKNKKKLQKLQQAIKEEKSKDSVKKTLQDFLHVIGK